MSRAGNGGRAIKESARRIAELLVAPGFAVEQSGTVLLLNSLITARHHGQRIFLNAFQRSGEVLNYFGHRLRRLGFEVHSLEARSIIPSPRERDVLICLSGSLRTEPVLVSILHADRGGLYKFVVTAQSAEEARKKFQSVLPVHIPGTTAEGRAEQGIGSLLPLGSLFELRAFLYFEAVIEALGGILSGDELTATAELDLMVLLRRVREGSGAVPSHMEKMTVQLREGLDWVDEEALDRFLECLIESADGHTTYLTGFGRNNEVGGMFAHRLGNLGVGVALSPSRHERPTRRGDFMVALTGSGYTYEVLQRLSGARRVGLRTACMTAMRESSAERFVDIAVVVPAVVEPRHTQHFAERQFRPTPATPPSQSTFGFNSLLLLEATFSVLMEALDKSENDLMHTDPWQGYDTL